jgi:hypothetical protein
LTLVEGEDAREPDRAYQRRIVDSRMDGREGEVRGQGM